MLNYYTANMFKVCVYLASQILSKAHCLVLVVSQKPIECDLSKPELLFSQWN